MGWLHGVTVYIEGARIVANFEVIEIVDDSNPYPVLLRIDWAFEMNTIINLKKWSMVFEKNELWVIVLLDPAEGVWYTKPNRHYYEYKDIENRWKDHLEEVQLLAIRFRRGVRKLAESVAWGLYPMM